MKNKGNRRIVSLLASSTEIVCALGFEDWLVGRSHECDYPSSVQRLPVCSEPKFDPTRGTSLEIDRQVKTIVRESLSVYRVDADKLKRLQPDVIITQDHCEVCAVSLKDVKQAVCHWLKSQPQIVTLRPNALNDVWKGMRQIATILGHPQKGRELVRECQQRMIEISRKSYKTRQNITVACIEWFEPLMAAGNWVPELITMLGAKSLFGRAGKHAPWITWEGLKRKDPDVIVCMPCGWDIERSRREIDTLAQRPGWNDLKAVRQGRIYLTDGNQYFNRPGPRLVESLEILAEIIYPDSFSPNHRGKGWQNISSP